MSQDDKYTGVLEHSETSAFWYVAIHRNGQDTFSKGMGYTRWGARWDARRMVRRMRREERRRKQQAAPPQAFDL